MIRENLPLFDELPLERACALLDVSRSDLYRDRARVVAEVPSPEDAALREAIERLVLEWPLYGYRRITAQLQRDGWEVNHKRVLRIMREEGWLCRRKRRWVRTTDSEHGLRVYPNLLADCGWRALTATDQAWAADITYIRLLRGFCYLATVLDGYSRRVVGWCLAESLVAATALAALKMALRLRLPPSGWIHHSDRGVQYACQAYVECVEAAGGRISMAGKGNPRENAQAESFVRTLKQEEVYLREYADFAAARRSIGRFIEDVYNEKRLHSALGYRPPTEFERLLAAGIPLVVPAHRRLGSKAMTNGGGNGSVATEIAELVVGEGNLAQRPDPGSTLFRRWPTQAIEGEPA